MKNNKSTIQTRLHILQAANEVILSQGVAHLTLEAVAQKAGVSKGGLLYHFSCKEALVEGLISELTQEFDAELEKQMQTEVGLTPAGRWLRAYIRTSFMPGQTPADLNAGLLAGINLNPELLTGVREKYRQWQKKVEQDGIDPVLATIIRLATDGLWLTELLDLGVPNPLLREQVMAKLVELSRGEK